MSEPITLEPPAPVRSPKSASVSGRIPELDGIRGVAILLVIIWHYLIGRFNPPYGSGVCAVLWSLLDLSWTGVDLFFVLSGFRAYDKILQKVSFARFFVAEYRFEYILPP